MQRFFTYGRKRRKAKDVSDVRLLGAAGRTDVEMQRETVIAILVAIKTRACLKIAFCQMCVPICGRFAPNERGVVGYGKRIWGKSPAKWGVQMAGMNFQTRSRPALLLCRHYL